MSGCMTGAGITPSHGTWHSEHLPPVSLVPPLVLIPTWHMVTPSPQSQLSTPCSHLRTPRPMSRRRDNGRRQRRSESRRSGAPRPRAHHTQRSSVRSDRAATECVVCYTRRKDLRSVAKCGTSGGGPRCVSRGCEAAEGCTSEVTSQPRAQEGRRSQELAEARASTETQ